MYNALLLLFTGVKQVICDGSCLDTDDNSIYGFRWKCLKCEDRDNCTPCYMKSIDEGCINHPFVRYITTFSTVWVKTKHPVLFLAHPSTTFSCMVSYCGDPASVVVINYIVSIHNAAISSYISPEAIIMFKGIKFYILPA